MKPTITRAILEHLAESGKLMIDAFFPKYYPGTGLVRGLFGLDHVVYDSPKQAKRTISSILNRLKSEGLVEHGGVTKGSAWSITRKGRRYLKSQNRDSLEEKVVAPSDGITRLVTFDVPEKEYQKRKWLRAKLIACGFEPLQKSVFIGKRPLPENVIKEIDALNLSSCVHIVKIESVGTLR